MQAFLVHYGKNKALIGDDTVRTIEDCLPVEYDRSYTWSSRDGRMSALFFEVESSLFPEGACIHVDTHGTTFFDGYLWDTGCKQDHLPCMAERLHRALQSVGVESVRAEYIGEYTLVHINEDQGELVGFTDAAAISHLYAYETCEGVFLSNRIDLIRAVVGVVHFEYDLPALAHHATWGIIPTGSTIYQSIRAISPGQVWRVKGGALTIKGTLRPFFDLPGTAGKKPDENTWDELIEELSTNLRFIRWREDISPRLGLSGGKDTRLILALAIKEGIAREILYFTNGLALHPDVIVAKEISSKYRLFHLIDEPTEMDADAVAKFHEGWPKYIAYSEGMHTLYEAHEYPLCGADPLLTGISGEVFRSALDLYGHDTSGVADLEGALAYIRERLWSDPANIVRDEVAEFHQLERAQWAEKQAELGTNPSELPSLLYAEHQAARNSAFRKANGRFCYTVNVLGGNLIYWLAFYRGADFRRKETIHFEIMKRLSPWLTYHHFAQQTWRPELLDPHLRTHPVELETAQAREMVSRTDWRCQIDTNPRFRAIIRDYLLSFPISHSLWDVIDRQKLEEWFNHPTHSNMSRFGFFGALTIAMILDDRRKLVRVGKSAKPQLVRAKGDPLVFRVHRGKKEPVRPCDLTAPMDSGIQDVRTVEPEMLARLA